MTYQNIKYWLLICLILINTKGFAFTLNSPDSSRHKQFRILSVDGGGVRGVIPARILQAIEEQTAKSISELFDLVIGTSTGGLVVLALVTPNKDGTPTYKAADLVKFYRKKRL